MSRCLPPRRDGGGIALLMMTAAVLTPSIARGSNALAADEDAGGGAAGIAAAVERGASALQLEVWINGRTTNQIAAFEQARDGGLSSRPSELRALGLRAPAGDALLRLAALPGVTYRYNEQAQRVDIAAEDRALIAQDIAVHERRAATPATSDTGAVVNYSLAALGGDPAHGGRWRMTELDGEIEARVFGPLGVVTVTAQGRAAAKGSELRLLDSAWSWSDPHTLLTMRAGDLISGGFDWTRPVRMGGLQLRREFALRPDLITMPAPNLSGSATVPSVAEVMVNGSTVLSRDVSGGPLVIRDLPATQGPSLNTLVLRDALGRETVLSIPFYTTPDFLKPGLLDFSLETGLARRFYGLKSLTYDGRPIASGSLRYGLSDWATAEAHSEAGAGLVLVGGGGAFRLGGVGALTTSLALSHYHGDTGCQLGLGLQGQFGGLSLSARGQSTCGRYTDLGAVTAPNFDWKVRSDAYLPPSSLAQINAAFTLRAFRPWRGVGPIPGPSIGLSYTSLTTAAGDRRQVWSTTVRQTLPSGVSLYATAYQASQAKSQTGFFLGLSLAFGGGRAVNVGVEGDHAGASAYAEASQAAELRPGAVGWRVRAQGGHTEDLEAEASYLAPFGHAEVMAQRLAGGTTLQARLNGAVAFMGGRPLLSDRINDAFAVVDAGRPHVPVTFENRAVGETGADGRLIVPYLAAYNTNSVSIDPGALPGDLTVESPRRLVAPAREAGVLVRFKVKAGAPGVLLTLNDAAGAALPVGAVGHLGQDQAHPFVVGYDGQAYVENSHDGDALTLALPDGHLCHAVLVGEGRAARARPCL